MYCYNYVRIVNYNFVNVYNIYYMQLFSRSFFLDLAIFNCSIDIYRAPLLLLFLILISCFRSRSCFASARSHDQLQSSIAITCTKWIAAIFTPTLHTSLVLGLSSELLLKDKRVRTEALAEVGRFGLLGRQGRLKRSHTRSESGNRLLLFEITIVSARNRACTGIECE